MLKDNLLNSSILLFIGVLIIYLNNKQPTVVLRYKNNKNEIDTDTNNIFHECQKIN